MEDIKKVIAENLINLRKEAKLTQTDLAEKLNYSDKAISKWEQGESLPGIDVFVLLAEIYDVNLDYFVQKNPARTEKKENKEKKNEPKKRVISLLAVSVVWILATIVFVYVDMLFSIKAWTVYIWALPISSIIGIVFNSIWGHHKRRTLIYVSCLVWTLLLSVYLQLLSYNFWVLFILGIPLQISIILWDNLIK